MAKGRKTGGRQKGTPNKSSAKLKDALLDAAEQAGGAGGLVGYLRTMAVEEPQSFLPLLGKILPKDVNVHEYSERLVRVIDHTGAGPVVHDVAATPIEIPAELDG